MGKPSRDKGARREREIAELLGATKVSLAWQPGADLDWHGRAVEVKARADGFRELYKWLTDAQVLALKADRREWLIVMRAEELLDILGEVATNSPAVCPICSEITCDADCPNPRGGPSE